MDSFSSDAAPFYPMSARSPPGTAGENPDPNTVTAPITCGRGLFSCASKADSSGAVSSRRQSRRVAHGKMERKTVSDRN